MRNLSLQEKEQNIIATLIVCNNELNLDDKNKYKNNMVQLYESIVGGDIIDSDSEIFESNNLIKKSDFRNNKYAYFQKVNNLIDNYDKDVIISLNENINQDSFNINNFKNELKKEINLLQNNNDFNNLDKLDSNILKIKIFAKKPIYVYGFNILNNKNLQKELQQVYNLNIENIIAIIFDKSNKQILFIFESIIITYVLENNDFGYYNDVWKDTENGNVLNINKINKTNYLEFIKTEINANIIVLYVSISNFDLTFKDNLFKDKFKETLESQQQNKNNNFFVK